MPGFLLHLGAAVMCAHGGQAKPISTNPRVKVMGQPTVVQPIPYSVAACSFNPGAPSPCVTAQWTTAATRIKSGTLPLLLFDSQATCIPNGTPVMITASQTRVRGL